jgi:hypothetical protein
MAHREQHGNREKKKPKKEKSASNTDAWSKRWAVSEALKAGEESKK